MPAAQTVELKGDAGGKRFDGIGVVNGGGATSVLLKDYPEPQRSQIMDLLLKPKFGASVSALLIEIPGDGNSTQGSMSSHMHTKGDLDYSRGYMWWVIREAKKRNPNLSLDGAAWSAPGWIGNGKFWSQDAADYYVKWLQGLRKVYGQEFDALGCRNEKGVSYEFAKMLRTFPYYETFDEYTSPKDWGYLPRYTADIADVFEIADRPDNQGKCLRQVVPERPISWAPDYMPYTILGDDQWQDYEVSVDVYLNSGDAAGVMGRVNNVGTGYGSIPKGYFLELGSDGQCRLVLIRGKKDKKKATGDAEQQALLAASKDEGEGGEKVLGTSTASGIGPNQWHNLKLRFAGSTITGFVDDKPVLNASDPVYLKGLVGLSAGSDKKRIDRPFFDNLLVKSVNSPVPASTQAIPGQSPMYGNPILKPQR